MKFTNLVNGAYTDIHSVRYLIPRSSYCSSVLYSGRYDEFGKDCGVRCLLNQSISVFMFPSNSSSGSAPGSASKSKSDVGKTVGIAVGFCPTSYSPADFGHEVGVVGVLAALVLFAFCFRRRKWMDLCFSLFVQLT
jgi:hypothetical protein